MEIPLFCHLTQRAAPRSRGDAELRARGRGTVEDSGRRLVSDGQSVGQLAPEGAEHGGGMRLDVGVGLRQRGGRQRRFRFRQPGGGRAGPRRRVPAGTRVRAGSWGVMVGSGPTV